MPALERHPWRTGDAVNILEGAKIVGRCEGINSVDGGRFHGFIVEPVEHQVGCLQEKYESSCCTCPQYAAYWHKGEFHVEEIAREGERVVCETCGSHGLVGVDGPLYGRDRDTRHAAVSRCRSCTTQVD
jgi:hypothetical protein